MAIWFGFGLVYQLARAAGDRNPARAIANGQTVVNFEEHVTNRLYELTFEQFVNQRHWLEALVSWTYWNSEFTVVGLALLWVYIRRTDGFIKFRNSILLANVLGLVGYVLTPMAPPGCSTSDSSTATQTASCSWRPIPTRQCRACTPATR